MLQGPLFVLVKHDTIRGENTGLWSLSLPPQSLSATELPALHSPPPHESFPVMGILNTQISTSSSYASPFLGTGY